MTVQETQNRRAEDELEELLAEGREEAAARAAGRFRLDAGDAVVLYGAGTLGRHVLSRLRSVGIEPAAFADDTPSKRGIEIDGLKVLTPREADERFGRRALYVVTILNPALGFREAWRRLGGAEGRRVVSFLEPAWKYPEAFLPHYQFVLPQDVLAGAEEIRRAFALFEDEESRRQFVAHLRFRLRLEHDALPPNTRAAYFAPDIPLDLGDDSTFVDCGAYDGDTLRRFLAHVGHRFSRAYAFEPDASNCQRLRDFISSLGGDAPERIEVFCAGVGAKRARLRFHSTGDMSASFASSAGEENGAAGADEGADDGVEVDVLALDEVVVPGNGALYLKFDVEGAEWDAFEGARRLVALPQTRLALSIYHRPEDLWLLPLRVRELSPRSRLFLRTEGEDGMDVVCYAVPHGGAW